MKTIAGDKCPVCEKGKFKKVLDEVEKGIKAEGFKCDKCGEIFFSQEITEKVRAMQRMHSEERRLVRIGNSLAAIIPSKIVKRMGLKEKEKIFVEEADGKIIIKAALK